MDFGLLETEELLTLNPLEKTALTFTTASMTHKQTIHQTLLAWYKCIAVKTLTLR